MILPMPPWFALADEAAAGALTQEFFGGELAFRFGSGPVGFGVGPIARVGHGPGEGQVEVGAWADLRVFVRPASVEIGGGPMLAVGDLGYSDGGYVPLALATCRVGPSWSSRWGPGVRFGGELRAFLFSAGGEATGLFGIRDDTVPLVALPTATASFEGYAVTPFVVGRPLRVPGGWALSEPVAGLTGRARRWHDQARGEFASVATFSRLARELAALGAPRSLVSLALEAAADEARHARACLELARHAAGRRLVLGPIAAPPARSPSRYTLAAEALVDGVIGEGVAARDAAIEADTTSEPGAARVLAQIAREEERHAALGAAVLDWSGGSPHPPGARSADDR